MPNDRACQGDYERMYKETSGSDVLHCSPGSFQENHERLLAGVMVAFITEYLQNTN